VILVGFLHDFAVITLALAVWALIRYAWPGTMLGRVSAILV
jgi:hypothetical protein